MGGHVPSPACHLPARDLPISTLLSLSRAIVQRPLLQLVIAHLSVVACAPPTPPAPPPRLPPLSVQAELERFRL